MTKFHSDDYVNFLRTITPENMSNHQKSMTRFNVGEDCPVCSGMYEFCQISAGGSVASAVKLNSNEADIAINWAGGLHHAKKVEASGFWYIYIYIFIYTWLWFMLMLLSIHPYITYIHTTPPTPNK